MILPIDHFRCTTCKDVLHKSLFFKNKSRKTGYDHNCKVCRGKNSKKDYNYEYSRKQRIAWTYDISVEDVQKIYDSQNGKCKICGVFKEGFSSSQGLVIDHCHSTGKIRGLLCQSCNAGIGHLQESPEIFRKALLYLEIENI